MRGIVSGCAGADLHHGLCRVYVRPVHLYGRWRVVVRLQVREGNRGQGSTVLVHQFQVTALGHGVSGQGFACRAQQRDTGTYNGHLYAHYGAIPQPVIFRPRYVCAGGGYFDQD